MSALFKREHDYAIRIMAYLAGLAEGEHIPVSRLAKRISIPLSFTARIVHQLKQKGLIETVQGRFGGISLARRAEEISLFDILKAVNFQSALNECLITEDICPLTRNCKIHIFFKEQQKKLFKALRGVKVQEMAFDHKLLE